MESRKFFLAGLSAIFLVSCGKPGTPPRGSREQAPPARPVRTVDVQKRPMARSTFVNGTLAAQERSMLSAKVPGRIETLKVDIGSSVRQGDVVAQIDPRDYQLRLAEAAAALAQARAALGLPPAGERDQVQVDEVPSVKQTHAVLEEATKNRERIRDLSRLGIAAQSELDTAEATYRVAVARHESSLEEARTRVAALSERRAQHDTAKKQLADTDIRSPFNGAVQTRPASLGEFLTTGAPIVQIVKTDPLRLRLEVPERESMLVAAGQPVRISIQGDTNAYAGKIARLSPALDEQTRMLLVEADVTAQGILRPGLFVRAEIIISQDEPGLSVPPEAIVTFAGLQKVVQIRDGKAFEKTVTTGRRGTGWIELTSGVAPGEEVILHPAGLRTGQPVVLAPDASASAPAALSAADAKTR